MSLDFYLYGPVEKHSCVCPECDHRHTGRTRARYCDLNISHNLTKMADVAGLYHPLWSPKEIGISTAAQLIPLLEEGLRALKGNPIHFKALNPSNGWGTYEGLVNFCERLLTACKEHPEAEVEANT